jgi:ABC-type sugar transport system ATPase subunit
LNIQLQNIVAGYGKTRVIHGITLEFLQGTWTFIAGPSASGKTTLLRLIAGLESPVSGSAETGGNTRLSMLFQETSLWPQLTVLENVMHALDRDWVGWMAR